MSDAGAAWRALSTSFGGRPTALALVCEALGAIRLPAITGPRIEAQLDRLRAGLAVWRPLGVGSAARCRARSGGARRRSRVRRPGPGTTPSWSGRAARSPRELDRRRFAEALGNVLANAAEHGSGRRCG